MFAILHGWRLEGMAVSVGITLARRAAGPYRSELAREKTSGASGYLMPRIIINNFRVQLATTGVSGNELFGNNRQVMLLMQRVSAIAG
jgi:hypothetical protein